MKLGYLIETNVPPYDGKIPSPQKVADSVEQFLKEGIAADRAGFDAVNVPERHMRPECHFPTPLQLLTALAVRTERIRLTTHALILTLYHPMQVAEQAAMIDNLSRGRHYLTVAMGYLPLFWKMIGATGQGRRDRFIEAVEILRLAFSGERFSYRGKYYVLDDVLLTPQPYQQSAFPIWLGGMVDASIARAGQYGDAWVGNSFPQAPDTWRRQLALYRDTAAKHGRPASVCCARDAWVAPTRTEALRTFATVADHYIKEMRFYFRKGIFVHPDFPSEASITLDALLPHLVIGSPADCVEKLQFLAHANEIDTCVLRLRMPTGPGFEQTLEAIALCGEEVIPRIHATA